MDLHVYLNCLLIIVLIIDTQLNKKVDLLNKAEVPESKLADMKKAQLAYSILLLSLADEQFPLVMQVPEGNANGV